MLEPQRGSCVAGKAERCSQRETGTVTPMAGFWESVREFTARKCSACDTKIESGEVHYVEYPRDLYCATCAKQHPGYNR